MWVVQAREFLLMWVGLILEELPQVELLPSLLRLPKSLSAHFPFPIQHQFFHF